MTDTDPLEARLQTAATLSEALPYMRRFTGKTFVIKFGGHAMGDETLAQRFARDVVLLKQVGISPVVVHGGGPQIGRMLERLKIESQFVQGLRITDAATVEIVEMVLAGSINKQIAADITAAGGSALGLSGKDGHLLRARRLRRTHRDPESQIEKVLDLGFVGEPESVDTKVLERLTATDIIPVIAPIGIGADGETYNINGDTAAGAIANALGATKLLMLTDVAGVLDQEGTLIPRLTPESARARIEDGTVSGGMVPKIETCIDAVADAVEAAHILDGRIPHVLLLEIFTAHGVGTMISPAAG
ncbi:MAG: acetylglutamate kinase [Alphaproteobacteria bacterium]|nr:acetylglutamate kinase [Alphaproteobacteria bacterium]